MIEAVFTTCANRLQGVEISGHAYYADPGQDVVCASVTSALQLCSNGITEVLAVKAAVRVQENRVSVELPPEAGQCAQAFLSALLLHLQVLSQDYAEYLKLTVLEV